MRRDLRAALPPGPRVPAVLQLLGTWTRPTATLERLRRYGKRVTVTLPFQPPFVILSDPRDIKELFTIAADVVHPGEGAQILAPIVGRNSVILLDERAHLEQRRLLLPAFHGERMQRLSGVMTELTEREVQSWPSDEPLALHEPLQRLTLEIILRAVFGLERGPDLDRLRDLLSNVLAFGESPLSVLPALQRWLGWTPTQRRFNTLMRETDELIFALIARRRADTRGDGPDGGDGGGDDVLTMLLGARHQPDGSGATGSSGATGISGATESGDDAGPADAVDQGTPMSQQELRDELMTALVAGHETTASQLAWALERLAREPAARARLTAEIDLGESDEYLSATITEILRLRPVLPNAEPRLTKEPVEIGGVRYPAGVVLLASAYLVHHDPEIYEDPHAFRPERFLGQTPGTYTWIPFGGGRRRCLGAAFAVQEMKIVLRAILRRYELSAPDESAETTRRRGITFTPRRGATVLLRRRTAKAASPVAALAARA